ncbi:MAG: hypothetical protein ACYDBW_08180 [Sulfuricaulis sp.]
MKQQEFTEPADPSGRCHHEALLGFYCCLCFFDVRPLNQPSDFVVRKKFIPFSRMMQV